MKLFMILFVTFTTGSLLLGLNQANAFTIDKSDLLMGGAAQIYNTNTDLSNLKISFNRVGNASAVKVYGGAFYIYSAIKPKIDFAVHNVYFRNNQALGASNVYAGAIYATGSYSGVAAVAISGESGFYYNSTSIAAGAVYISSYSSLDFQADCIVDFKYNSSEGLGSTYNGGALYTAGTVNFNERSKVVFESNSVTKSGGAIFHNGGSVNFKNYCDVTFFKNSAGSDGGAIATAIGGNFNFLGGKVVFNKNSAGDISSSGSGGAVHTWNPMIFSGGTVVFTGNTSSNYAGAIYCTGKSLIFNGGTVFFGTWKNDKGITEGEGNSCNNNGGGAIHAQYVLFQEGRVEFNNNFSRSGGGAIQIMDNYSPSNPVLGFFGGTVAFDGNLSNGSGSAIYLHMYGGSPSNSGSFIIFGGSNVTFRNYSKPPIYFYVTAQSNSCVITSRDVYIFMEKWPTFSGSGDKIRASANSACATLKTNVHYYTNAAPPNDWPYKVNENGSLEDRRSLWAPAISPVWEIASGAVSSCIYNGPGDTTCPAP